VIAKVVFGAVQVAEGRQSQRPTSTSATLAEEP
jgi:hypothetical protein